MKTHHALIATAIVIAAGVGAGLSSSKPEPTMLPNPTMAAQTDLTVFDGCGPEGSATKGDAFEENPLKNRWQPEDSNTGVTLDMLMAAKVDAPLPQNSNAAIEGILALAKPGGIESCNCGSATDIDTHMYIVANAGDDYHHGLIVEVTPRIRALHPDWTQEYLKSLEGRRLRITGDLLCDKEHRVSSFADNPNGKRNWRGSCWELHPVTAIKILK